MFKILKYSFFDLMRSRWTYFYFGFYLLFTLGLLLLSGNLSKVIISLMNAILVLSPLIATMFGIMYYYNSREFVELLLAQPIRRTSIFLGQYLGLALSLALSLLLGIGLPFVLYGILRSGEIFNFLILLLDGVFLSFIFSGLAFVIALRHENRIKGFGLAIVVWLLLAVVYDGFFLLALVVFNDYPLESFSLIASVMNPIDLSRILILLKLDLSALMGYTGAVFQRFFGHTSGILLALTALIAWTLTPVWAIKAIAMKKDF